MLKTKTWRTLVIIWGPWLWKVTRNTVTQTASYLNCRNWGCGKLKLWQWWFANIPDKVESKDGNWKKNIFQKTQNFYRGCDMNNGRQRLVEDWSGDEEDESAFLVGPKAGDGDSRESPWCRKCSTAGRMSGRERDSWSRSGYCDNLGCPGYSGHPPASRPQGESGVSELRSTSDSCAENNSILINLDLFLISQVLSVVCCEWLGLWSVVQWCL